MKSPSLNRPSWPALLLPGGSWRGSSVEVVVVDAMVTIESSHAHRGVFVGEADIGGILNVYPRREMIGYMFNVLN